MKPTSRFSSNNKEAAYCQNNWALYSRCSSVQDSKVQGLVICYSGTDTMRIQLDNALFAV
jgi:hypothetical protein